MSKFDLYTILKEGLDVGAEAKTVSVVPRLEPKDYGRVKSILNRLGGAWNISRQCFEFQKDPVELIQRVLDAGSRAVNKFHFHPTSESVFDFIAEHTSLSFIGSGGDPVRTLEPSCGEGALINALNAFGDSEGRKFDIDAYELDNLNVIVCEGAGIKVEQADFLKVEPVPVYDFVLMNPPFNGEEFIKHIQHAQKFLSESGTLISVVPTGWLMPGRSSKAGRWLLEQAQLSSGSALAEPDWFEKGTFAGVQIETTVVELVSAQRAEKIMAGDRYRASSIDLFNTLFSSSERHMDRAAKALSTDSHTQDIDLEMALVRALGVVDGLLNDSKEETCDLPRRFRDDYARSVVEDFLPHLIQTEAQPVGQIDLFAA